MHNIATDMNDGGEKYNHKRTQRIDLRTLCHLLSFVVKPVAFTACVGSIQPQQTL